MPDASVLWPEVEVENGSSGCCCGIIPFKSASETGRGAPRPPEARLGDALLETHRIRSGSRLRDVLGTLLLHGVLLASVVLIPLWHTDALDLESYTRTLLVGPPPPPPPPAGLG